MAPNPFEFCHKKIDVGGKTYSFYDLTALNDPRYGRGCWRLPNYLRRSVTRFVAEKLPVSIRVLLESAVRHCDEFHVLKNDVENILAWSQSQHLSTEVPFKPARVLLQDFT